jgi:transcriptional regulator with XRE-family HTH domain
MEMVSKAEKNTQEMASRGTELQSRGFGTFLRNARIAAGLSIAGLSQAAGIAVGQVHKLENDRVQKINPAHIAALAGPLGVPLYRLYQAAGYPAEQIPLLEPELVQRLMELPPEALKSITGLLDGLMTTGSASWDGPRLAPALLEDISDEN